MKPKKIGFFIIDYIKLIYNIFMHSVSLFDVNIFLSILLQKIKKNSRMNLRRNKHEKRRNKKENSK